MKGNRNVTVQKTEIHPFHTIDLDEDFEVEIIFKLLPSVEVETNKNLRHYIEFRVIDSVLVSNKKVHIRSKKKSKHKSRLQHALKYIRTTDDADILSLATTDLTHATVIAKGSSKVGLL